MPGDVCAKFRAAAVQDATSGAAIASITAAKRSDRGLAVTPYEITATPWREDPKERPLTRRPS
jgi:hypothetical protein